MAGGQRHACYSLGTPVISGAPSRGTGWSVCVLRAVDFRAFGRGSSLEADVEPTADVADGWQWSVCGGGRRLRRQIARIGKRL